jgi:hypothetical protein
MTSTGQLRQQVNETIIQALEQGKVPWRSDHGFPKNVLSRRRYGGIEAICLMMAGCPSPYWGTRSEWEALGGKVKDGPGTQIVVRRGALFESLRPLTIYNLCQVSGDFPVSRNKHPTVDYGLVERPRSHEEQCWRRSGSPPDRRLDRRSPCKSREFTGEGC